jgi:hypothetical protein
MNIIPLIVPSSFGLGLILFSFAQFFDVGESHNIGDDIP